ERLPVSTRHDSAVKHRTDASIIRAPDQAPKTLLEAQNRLRHGIVPKRIIKQLASRCEHWIGWHRERELRDYQQAQRATNDVDALPERVRPQQHRSRVRPQSLNQLTRGAIDA